MERVILIFTIFMIFAFSSEKEVENHTLEVHCLFCHKKQEIPDKLIYSRYLMQYSTDSRMQKAIFKYLKNPQEADSIMPLAFFSKFYLQEPTTLKDKVLREYIDMYLKKYNLKKKLVLEK